MITEIKMEANFTKEHNYLKAKKRVKDIKGFYVHLFVYLLTMPIVIIVNLMFVPGFHFFWFAVLGWFIGVFFHWLAVFGFNKIGFSKEWEENKIKEFMQEQNKYNKRGK
ncbi:MAG: 2TM domain-containing protein [Polaribacter sp.]|uniref:2TM domain-containing protein n=1 Tax=Polaribacter sp. TaxID=1920175 RepID=UPI003267996F